MDNIMECITVGTEMEKSKYILISCLYRKPGSCINIFREVLSELYNNINNKKIFFVRRDFNIDLLNPQEYNTTTEFITLMYSISLYTSISRQAPTLFK